MWNAIKTGMPLNPLMISLKIDKLYCVYLVPYGANTGGDYIVKPVCKMGTLQRKMFSRPIIA